MICKIFVDLDFSRYPLLILGALLVVSVLIVVSNMQYASLRRIAESRSHVQYRTSWDNLWPWLRIKRGIKTILNNDQIPDDEKRKIARLFNQYKLISTITFVLIFFLLIQVLSDNPVIETLMDYIRKNQG